GGASLYPTLAFKANDPTVLRILVSIGGVEIDHFGLWHDKGGNAVSQPLAGVVDPVTGLTFPDLNNPATELTQTNKILPEPCNFSWRHNSKVRLRPMTMMNPCCFEPQMAQSPMSRIHSPRERASSLWRNSKLDHKCA